MYATGIEMSVIPTQQCEYGYCVLSCDRCHIETMCFSFTSSI